MTTSTTITRYSFYVWV